MRFDYAGATLVFRAGADFVVQDLEQNQQTVIGYNHDEAERYGGNAVLSNNGILLYTADMDGDQRRSVSAGTLGSLRMTRTNSELEMRQLCSKALSPQCFTCRPVPGAFLPRWSRCCWTMIYPSPQLSGTHHPS